MDPLGMLVNAALFLGVEVAKKSADDMATACLRSERFDLVLSDIARGQATRDGLHALPQLLQAAPGTPVVFYVGFVAPDRSIPAGSKGIAGEPNEPLHLVLDQLERTRL